MFDRRGNQIPNGSCLIGGRYIEPEDLLGDDEDEDD
jgi:hypothetical protein